MEAVDHRLRYRGMPVSLTPVTELAAAAAPSLRCEACLQKSRRVGQRPANDGSATIRDQSARQNFLTAAESGDCADLTDLHCNDRPHHNQQRHPLPDQIGVTKTGRHKHHLHAISESPRNGEFLWNPNILVSTRRSHWRNIVPFSGRYCGLDCLGVIDR